MLHQPFPKLYTWAELCPQWLQHIPVQVQANFLFHSPPCFLLVALCLQLVQRWFIPIISHKMNHHTECKTNCQADKAKKIMIRTSESFYLSRNILECPTLHTAPCNHHVITLLEISGWKMTIKLWLQNPEKALEKQRLELKCIELYSTNINNIFCWVCCSQSFTLF